MKHADAVDALRDAVVYYGEMTADELDILLRAQRMAERRRDRSRVEAIQYDMMLALVTRMATINHSCAMEARSVIDTRSARLRRLKAKKGAQHDRETT